MSSPMTIFYVSNPLESADFYGRLFGCEPIERSPGFAAFEIDGARLGLWARAGVLPTPPVAVAGGSELAFAQSSDEAVDCLHAQWQEAGVPIAQKPEQMDFGYTFTALDPDGHRLRVFCMRDG